MIDTSFFVAPDDFHGSKPGTITRNSRQKAHRRQRFLRHRKGSYGHRLGHRHATGSVFGVASAIGADFAESHRGRSAFSSGGWLWASETAGLLALADTVVDRRPESESPLTTVGLLITLVSPNSNAGEAGLGATT